MNDEDFMNIVDDVFEEMNVDNIIEEMGGESDEDGPLADDSDYISDYSKDFTQFDEKILDNSQINALNGNTKQCDILLLFNGQ